MEESRQREEVGGLEEGLESRNFVLILSNSPPLLLPFLPFSKNLVLDEDNTPENG